MHSVPIKQIKTFNLGIRALLSWCVLICPLTSGCSNNSSDLPPVKTPAEVSVVDADPHNSSQSPDLEAEAVDAPLPSQEITVPQLDCFTQQASSSSQFLDECLLATESDGLRFVIDRDSSRKSWLDISLANEDSAASTNVFDISAFKQEAVRRGAKAVWRGSRFMRKVDVFDRLRASSPLRIAGARSLTVNAMRVSSRLWLFGMVFNYAAAFGGAQDFDEANRVALSFAMGAVAATGFVAATTTMVVAIGTASTGTAIASLSGAAATSAVMAWLGGGTIAAGGFGAAGGSVVLTGGAALIALAVSSAVLYGFSEWDDSNRLKLTELRLNHLIKKHGLK